MPWMVLPPLPDSSMPSPLKLLITSPFTVLSPAVMRSPSPATRLPSNTMIGLPAKSGSLVPSSLRGSVMVGRMDVGWMV